MHRMGGFTLVELVVVIVLSTIVISFMAMFIAGPVRGYTDQVRRAELVDLGVHTRIVGPEGEIAARYGQTKPSRTGPTPSKTPW